MMRYLLLAIAVLTCPCHLPIWLALLGSTAVGALLSRHTGVAALAFTALFVVSAWASFRLFPGGRPHAFPRRPR